MPTTRTIQGRTRIPWVVLALTVTMLPGRALGDVRVTARPDGRSLTIVGDRAADEVVVALDAEGDAVEVSSGAVPLGRFATGPLESIRIRLGGGDDALAVGLASGGRLGLRMLSVNLGGGDDFASLDLDPGLFATGTGGSGEDTVRGGSADGLRSVEKIVTSTALINNGGGSLGYDCPIGGDQPECVCDPRSPPDCLLMAINACTPASVEALIECVANASPLFLDYCWCPRAASSAGGDPTSQFPADLVPDQR